MCKFCFYVFKFLFIYIGCFVLDKEKKRKGKFLKGYFRKEFFFILSWIVILNLNGFVLVNSNYRESLIYMFLKEYEVLDFLKDI